MISSGGFNDGSSSKLNIYGADKQSECTESQYIESPIKENEKKEERYSMIVAKDKGQLKTEKFH